MATQLQLARMRASNRVTSVYPSSSPPKKGQHEPKPLNKLDHNHTQPPNRLSAEEEASKKNAEILLESCRAGNLERVKALLQKEVSPDSCDAAGTTGLCLAAKAGNSDIVEFLLGNGAHAEALSGSRSPLSWAADSGHSEVILLLLKHRPTLKLNQADSFGLTPLMEAVRSGHQEVVKLLLSKGADVNATSKTLSSCLTFAAEKNNLPMVELLLNNGASLGHKTAAGFNAEQLARMAGFLNIVSGIFCLHRCFFLSTKEKNITMPAHHPLPSCSPNS